MTSRNLATNYNTILARPQAAAQRRRTDSSRTYIALFVERAEEVGGGGGLRGAGLAHEQHGPLDADLQPQQPLGTRRVERRHEDLVELALGVVHVLRHETLPRLPLSRLVVVEEIKERFSVSRHLTCQQATAQLSTGDSTTVNSRYLTSHQRRCSAQQTSLCLTSSKI